MVCTKNEEIPISSSRGLDLLDAVVHVPDQGAVLAALAVLDVGAQRVLEARGLAQADLSGAQRRVDGAVEHEAADVGGEEIGVGGAQVGAVGVPEVAQCVVADHGPQDVEIAGGGDRFVRKNIPYSIIR